jgi:predicted house-cleaning noncanonical NTP pyrophosphatase (MazG superfamily)
LIRDSIPEIVRQKGIEPSTRMAENDQEYLGFILKKVVEEAQELSEAKADSNIIEEIADVYEIIDALIELKQFSKSDVTKVQSEKREKRGAFNKRLIMLKRPT